jgi:hypothetical protein
MNLSKRFAEGIKKYNLTIGEIQGGDWVYAGGDSNAHANYWKLSRGKQEMPPYQEKCVCGHNITEQCYITDGNTYIVMGNCCIKRFIPKKLAGRTCDKCKEPHRNRIVNRCNSCRLGLCDMCGISTAPKYTCCYLCYNIKVSKRRSHVETNQ